MPTTTKQTDTQLLILSHAAQQADGRVLPTPANLQAKGGALKQALKALLKRGLVAEQAASNSDEEWRREETDIPLTLVITPAGLAAIGLEPGDHVPVTSDPEEAAGPGRCDVDCVAITTASCGAISSDAGSADATPTEQMHVAGHPGTKSAAITGLLKRDRGATLAELTAATGWQAHSVRGFLAGTLKKKLGYTVASERGEDGVRRYRIGA